MTWVTRLRRDDDGVMLILAMAFMALFGVFAASLLGAVETGTRAHRAFAAHGEFGAAAEAAVEAAIEVVRTDLLAGRDPALGGRCPGSSPIPQFTVNGVQADVTCQGQPGSGSGGPVNSTAPGHAILSLGSDPLEDGITRNGTAGVSVDGRVFSHSTIRSPAGVFTVNGRVDAVGVCTGTIVSLAPPLHCSNQAGGAADPASTADPEYPPAITFAPPHRDVPACPASGVIALEPGWYDDASALNALTDGSCLGRSIHLLPDASGVGAFYFDFKNAGEHQWLIDDTTMKVIGGTPKGWVAGVPAAVPGACKTSTDPAPNYGVQVILGGDSRIKVNRGGVELCAQPTANGPQIAVYGVAAGTGPSFAAAPATTTVANDGFISPDQATGQPDSSVALATGSATRSITLGGFGSIVPANAAVTSVTVRVTHQDLQDVGAVRVTVLPGGGGAACPTISLGISSAMRADGDVGNASACLTNAVAVNGMRVKVDAVPAFPGDALRPMVERLDAVTIEVAYGGNGLQGASGCVIATPYPTTGCARLETGDQATLSIRGTVYTPKAALHFRFGSASVQSVDRGIIGRTVRLEGSVGVSIPGAPVGTSAPTTRTDRVVRFEASIAGVPRVRAEVTFRDGGGLTPGASVEITSWSFLTEIRS